MNQPLDAAILARGKAFFASIRGESPSIFNKGFWTGKVMDWAMQNEAFKVQLFRFVDVLPYLTTSGNLSRHIEEYFAGGEAGDIPPVLKWGAEKSGMFGGVAAKLMGKAIRSNIEGMARQFIVGEKTKEAVKNLSRIRKDGFAFTVDLLGEATVSEIESDAYRDGYLEVLAAIEAEQKAWKPFGAGAGGLDWGSAPKVNASIKPSALFSQARPMDFEGSVEGILSRMRPVYRKVKNLGGALCIDMEQVKYKDITIELFKRLRSEPEFRDYPHLSIVLQAYLRDTEHDLTELIAWGRAEGLPFGIRLVKGAYWDYETVVAKQMGWPVPVWTRKAESDMAHEKLSRIILENSDLLYFQCASHNIRTIANVMETAAALGVAENRFEFQALYGMAEPVRKGLLNVAGRVRLYCPYGELLPGMAYLVRRLLENTANESFLRQSFADGEAEDRLLENPEATLARDLAENPPRPAGDPGAINGLTGFRGEPLADFTVAELRQAFPEAIASVRARAGQVLPLVIGGKEIATDDRLPTVNPADPTEVLATVCQAGIKETDAAIEAAQAAFAAWRDKTPRERAEVLLKAAAIARRDIVALSAAQVLEVGKQWDQAYNDVGEAIDFLEYYAREAVRLGTPRRMGREPGEKNHLFYEPKGVCAVIAPWNFPLAISCGMSAAAIVAGNTVVFKPSGLASLIGHGLVALFKEAGLPDGVFNFCPGRGSVMGDRLVEHPAVATIAFTGSMETGLRIQEKAARVQPGQAYCKRVIAEMGGKNAIIIDDDADLDEAILGVVYSAFGFQGQKCSACSRVIVVDSIYDKFVTRLTEACSSLKIGPAEDPENAMGPVVDPSQQKKVLEYLEIARSEGKVLVERTTSGQGYYAPLVVAAGIRPEHRLAQEEVFGPILAVMKAESFDEALSFANASRFALTGGVYSRSPRHLEKARREFRVGNLYLNRNCVGAMVGRQPFGGSKMSGVGSKAGGPDYLLQFMDPRVVTENTIRRGFTPIDADDEWVD
ncbi:delta-1-pyrroline-5-carboxylate dehydrogenase [Solidesulfovibrio carbinoliphilus subsp. oakridgensis]|uniref:L-glutamate gamma-semialdehyde dehydrogenase n=1 Tax=Solidesulfovibrio carbinoliphilus subsp. oakridgensis TaxID=694327 RepID=G7Q9C9_9BACT|nr:L-glutamate gamma-semialdehyde dehydrogenase [Solidesulfovibrio carbinoliphilus]EHJ48172.1 delta-1-pyrroline-5-carboxylate dehydrogenase [Solidesulfovibrio carbinoliphilus subsp. oakridgensis]